MNFIIEFVRDPNHRFDCLVIYFLIACLISIFLGICGAPRHWFDRKAQESLWMRCGEMLRCATWDFLIHLVGFMLIPVLLFFASVIGGSSGNTEKIISGILFLPLFFYMIFCISGRGVEVLHRTIMSGVKEIAITWRGIYITFGDNSNKKNEPNK